MDHVTVLVTGGGAPGIAGTIHSLRENWDRRPLRIVSVDKEREVVGQYLADAHASVPAANDPGFCAALLDICRRERVDVVLPQVTAELPVLAVQREHFEREGVRVAVADAAAIERANDKYALGQLAVAAGLPTPRTTLVSTFAELARAAAELGHPGQPVAVKQPRGNGMRGYRALFAGVDRKRLFYEQKPDSSQITLDELHSVLGDSFPPLMVMEYLPGAEYTVDLLASGDRVHAVIPRDRTQVRTGITFRGRTLEHRELIRQSDLLARALGLRFAFGFQFKEDRDGVPKLLECNPRVQGTMVMATVAGANLIYGAVKLALGESVPEFDVRWGTLFLRYWGGVAVFGDDVARV